MMLRKQELLQRFSNDTEIATAKIKRIRYLGLLRP